GGGGPADSNTAFGNGANGPTGADGSASRSVHEAEGFLMDKTRSSILAILDMIIGVALVIVALWMHLLLPGISFALMLIGGVLLAVSGFYYR
ncbi:MAG TPA: hypothetical protein VII81_01990, partial [Terriglobales bacterium]